MLQLFVRPFATLRNADREQVRFVGTVTGGHMAIHWYQGVFPVVTPTLKAALGLTDVEVGALTTARQLTNGFLNLPAGMVADAYPRHRAIALALAIVVMGASYTIIGITPVFAWALVASMLIGVGNCVWHPAAQASLSSKFPRTRGAMLAIHGTGATVMDSITPIAVGALLAVLAWQHVLTIQIVPALIVAFLIWRTLSPSFRGERETVQLPSLRSQFKGVGALMKNPVFMGVSIASGLWTVGRNVVLTFLPIYLQEYLGYSTVVLGLYIALLNVLGIMSQSVLGLLSDRFGRKVVLVPSFTVLGVLYILLAYAPPGLALGATIAAIGLFFYTLANVTAAAVFDVVDPAIAASSVGMSTLVTQIFVLPAPIVAGAMIGVFGIGSVFVGSGLLMILGALVMVPLRMYRGGRRDVLTT